MKRWWQKPIVRRGSPRRGPRWCRPFLERLEYRLAPAVTLSTAGWTDIGPGTSTLPNPPGLVEAPIIGGQVPGSGGVSGRVTGIAADQTPNSNIIFIATAGGGVWKTTDGGNDWAPVTDNVPDASGNPAPEFMGAIAIAPSNDQVIYAGTGEANNGGDNYYGEGIFVSQTGGGVGTWTLTGQVVPPGSPAGTASLQGAAISRIAVDPLVPGTAYAAVSNRAINGANPPNGTGIYETVDFGVHWKNITLANTTTAGVAAPLDNTDPWTDVVIDPATSNKTGNATLFAAVGNQNGSAGNGIYISTNGGVNWSPSPIGGLPNKTAVGRISLAITDSTTPGASAIVEASIASPTVAGNSNLVGLFQSSNGGPTWTSPTWTNLAPNLAPPGGKIDDYLAPVQANPKAGQQGWYDNVVAINPKTPGTIFVAGVLANQGPTNYSGGGIEESTNAGTSWNEINVDSKGNGPHTDYHAMAFDANGRLLVGNDGGVWRLEANNTWTDLNNNLEITTFYGISLSENNASVVFGGSQDNGSEESNVTPTWPRVASGDGGMAVVDPNNPNRVYLTVNKTLQISTDSGATFNNANDPNPQLNNNSNGIATLNTGRLFVPPFTVDGKGNVYFGTDEVNLCTNPTASTPTWTQIGVPGSKNFNPSDAAITSIKVDPNDPTNGTVYVSTIFQPPGTPPPAPVAQLFVTTNALATPASSVQWKEIDNVGGWPGTFLIGGRAAFNGDPDCLTMPVGGAAGTAFVVGGNAILMTVNGTNPTGPPSWSNITGAGLPPNANILSIAALPGFGVFVGTDVGVYATTTITMTSQATTNPGGVIWSRYPGGLPGGLPNAQVTDLVAARYPDVGTVLAAATHGRGVWEILLTPGPVAPPLAGFDPGKKVFEATNSNMGPALATVNINNAPVTFIAWTGQDDKLNIAPLVAGGNPVEPPATFQLTSNSGPSLATMNNQMYIAFTGKNGDHDIYVAPVNISGTAVNSLTITIGTLSDLGVTSDQAPTLAVFDNSLYGGSNHLYVAFTSKGNQTLNVMDLFVNGGSISPYQTPFDSGLTETGSPALASAYGQLFVAFTGQTNKLFISTLDVQPPNGTVGNIAPVTPLSETSDYGPTLAFLNGVLYLGWTAQGNGAIGPNQQYPSVMKIDPTPPAADPPITFDEPHLVDRVDTSNNQLVLGINNGTPIVAFTGTDSNNHLNVVFLTSSEPGTSLTVAGLIITGNTAQQGQSGFVIINNNNGAVQVTMPSSDPTSPAFVESYPAGSITTVGIQPPGANNTVVVDGVPQGVAVTIQSTGSDFIDIGNGLLGNIQGSVIIKGSGQDVLLLDDSRDASAASATLNAGALDFDGVSSLVSWSGLIQLTYDGSQGSDTTSVLAAAAPTTVVGGDGTNIFNVGATTPGIAAGTLANLFNVVTVAGGPGPGATNRLFLSDAADANADTVTASAAGGDNGNDAAASDEGSLPISGTVKFVSASLPSGGAVVTYSGTFTDPSGTPDGVSLWGSNNTSASNIYNVQGTPLGDTTQINGAGGNDIFNVSSDAPTNDGNLEGIQGPLSLVGGAGSDNQLNLSDRDGINHTWNINGTNSGNIDGSAAIDFAGIQNLQGGSENDRFAFFPGGSVSGNIDGGDGLNTLDYSNLTSPVTVNLQNDSTGTGATFTNISHFVGGTSSTVVGLNADSVWTLTGLNSFSINGLSFAQFQNIAGGSGADRFIFLSGGVSGSINGGSGINTLDYSTFPGNISVNLALGAATGVGQGVSNIEDLFAGSGNATLVAGSGDNYLVAGIGQDCLVGGSGADILNGSLGQGDTILGGSGQDTIWGSQGADSINGGSGSDVIYAGPVGSFIAGGAGADTIVGEASNDTIYGEGGPDVIVSGGADNLIYADNPAGTGDSGAVSYIYGTYAGEEGAGTDTIYGGKGNDYLFGDGDAIHPGGAGSIVDNSLAADPNPSPPAPAVSPNGPYTPPSFSTTLPAGANYQGRWSEFAGSASVGGVSGTPGQAIDPSVVAGAGGEFVAWADSRNGIFQIDVAGLVGKLWKSLGSLPLGGGLVANAGPSLNPSITLGADGQPVVAWTIFTGSQSDIFVAYYDPSANGGAGGWLALNNSLSAGGISGSGLAIDPAVVETANGLVVAYLDRSSGSANIYVKEFTGGQWVALGSGAASGSGVSASASDVNGLSIATDGTNVAVAWSQAVGATRQIYLLQYSNGAWAPLGGSAAGNGLSNSYAQSLSPTLAYDNGSLFAGWQDNSSGAFQVYAATWNGSTWTALGNGLEGSGSVSDTDGMATAPQLAANGGSLYLLWLNNRMVGQGGNRIGLYITSWNGSAFIEQIVGDASYGGIGSATDVPAAPVVAVNPSGQPFVAWQDTSSTNSQIYFRGNTFALNTTLYINDSSTDGDAFSTTAGSATGTGLTPDSPTISVANLAGSLQPGDLVYVDAGTYGNLSLTSAANGVLLLGSPNGPTVIQGANLTGASNVILQDITFDGGVILTNCTNVTLLDCIISGSGVTIDGGSGNQIVHDIIQTSSIGIALTDATAGAVIEHDQILGGSQGITITGSGVTGLVVRYNQLAGSNTGIALSNAATGQITVNSVTSVDTALLIAAPFTGPIAANDFSGAATGVSYQVGALLNGNRIYNNGVGILSAVAAGSGALGFVPGSVANQIFANGVGVQLVSATMELQHVYENQTGVTGSGTLTPADLNHANLIDENNVGVNFTGPIAFNQIESNTVAIDVQSNQLIAHNLIVGNTQTAVEIQGLTRVSVINNTLVTSAGDLVRIEGGSSEIELENNIFWTSQGYDIYVANDSQSGFYSDYNDLYADGSGILVHWDIDFKDILDWQADLNLFDLHSVGATVVNPQWARPRFVGLAMDDYRVVDLLAGLRLSSPTINAGDPLTDEALPATYQNLLTNPGFESGLTGWTASPSGSTQSANPAPWAGNNYFFAGPNAVVTLDQTVNLTASGLTTTQIDAGNQTLIFGGRVRSANEAPPDGGSISLTFYDSMGNVIATSTDNASNLSTRWELVGSRVTIPSGARTARFRFTAIRNSGSTNDSYLDGAFVSVQSDAAALDQGAYGTANTVSHPNNGPVLRLISPDLYTDWLDNVPVAIRWESLGNITNAYVRIDLYQDGSNGPQYLLNIIASTPDSGEYDWKAANSGISYGTHGLRIEISLLGSANVFDRSTEGFTVPENTTTFYVNDNSTLGDQYTTAPGSNRNDGRTAAEPKPYPNNILRIYTLGPSDTLYVDAGNYALLLPLVLSGISGIGDDRAFTFTGPTSVQVAATLSLANPLTAAPVLTLDDADFMNLDHLTFTGGQYGVLAENNSTNFDAGYLTFSHNSVDGLLVEDSPNLTLESSSAMLNGQVGIRVLAGSTVLDMGSVTAFGNGSYGIYVDGAINRVHNSSATFNGNDGIHLTNVNGAVVQADTASSNTGAGIFVNQLGATQAVVGDLDLTQNLGNIVANNAGQGILSYGNVLVAGNVVSGSTGAGMAGIYLDGGGEAANNDLFNNDSGIITYGANAPLHGNRVYDNVTAGIVTDLNSPVYNNVVYSNGIGIQLGVAYSAEINNNLIYANTAQGILVRNGAGHAIQIVNNTIYEPQGDGVRLEQQSANVQLRNNIIWVQAGFDLSVASDSQVGFTSDYNILYTGGAGQVALWQQVARPTLAAWRNADFTDADSLALNPLFVNPLGADGVLGYVSASNDGRDDDFHEQSLQGSYHGGALAPVVSTTTGLPTFPSPTLTADANESPAIDLGAPTDSYTNEPAPNGGYINIGAYGNTGQASLSPTQYLIVTRPGVGGEVWPEGQSFNITWRFALAPVNGSTPPAGTVGITLLQVGNPMPVLTIASGVPNNGQYSWTPPSTLVAGTNYLVEVTSDQYTGLTATSAQPFTIAAPIHTYYINDGSFNPGDWTTAPGNDSNDGLSPATPKASIAGVLGAYHLNPGDTIMVDAGTYNLNNVLVLGATASGIIIEGYNGPNYPASGAVFNRGLSSSDVIDVSGAANLTLENLTITGGATGIAALDNTSSTNLMINNCTIYANSNIGIYLGSADNNAEVVDNVVYGLPNLGSSSAQTNGIVIGGTNGVYDAGDNVSGNTVYNSLNTGITVNGWTQTASVSNNHVYGSGTGISANSNSSGLANVSTIASNTVFDNSTGILAGGNVLVSQNTVYGQTSVGINSVNAYEVLANTVYNNLQGIVAFSTVNSVVANNTIYDNSSSGLEVRQNDIIKGNAVYGNTPGILVDLGTGAQLDNNLVYGNNGQGILLSDATNVTLVNNTVYQPTGDGIDLAQTSPQVTLQNNILWTQAGYDLSVAPASEPGFQSDYNDLYTTGTGSIGLWEGQPITSLASWILELNQDRHSLSADPQFVNVASADFHVNSGSATIDAGNPADPVGLEPAPNGSRINQGSDGGTPQATSSQPQELQLLSPIGLEKLQAGSSETITWRTAGLFAPSDSYFPDVLSHNPLAYYRLDETSGTTASDSSANGLNGTYTGGITLGQPGALPFNPDTAAGLDGSSGYVQLPSGFNDFSGGLTFEVWVFPTAVQSGERFIALGNGPYSSDIELGRSGSSNDLFFGISGDNNLVAPGAISLNQWQYFTVTLTPAGAATIYKNGAAIATGTMALPLVTNRTINFLGRSEFEAYGDQYFAGSLDEAAIYPTALPASVFANRYAHATSYGTVHIDLLQNGVPVQAIATGVPDNGSYTWNIPASETPGNGYQVRVTADNGANPSGSSPQPFLISNSGHDYYIAVGGSDSNSGTDPAHPMASLSALLTAYPNIGSGSTVHIGSGTYTLVEPVTIGAGHSGLSITGPASGPPAIFNRGNPASDVIDVAGAANLTLEYLTVTAGNIGIALLDNTNSTSVTVTNCTVFDNNTEGIYVGAGNNNAQIVANVLYGLNSSISTDNQASGIVVYGGAAGFSGAVLISGNTVYNSTLAAIAVNSTGIGPRIQNNNVYASGTGITIQTYAPGAGNTAVVTQNTVFDNATGISANGNILVEQNEIYGQSGTGIAVQTIDEVLANIVHDNAVGISAYSSGGAIANNTVYHNSMDGIEPERNSPVTGNTVYGNATGIALDYASLGPVSNNLVYENTSQAILVTYFSSPVIVNNTLYQPAGDAIDIQNNSSNVVLGNNILWTQAGYDVNVDATSEVGFQSDYNDLYATGSGKLGSWQGQTFLTQSSWFYRLGQDQHSLTVDPQFVNPAGPDGVLGYSPAAIGAAQIIDDSSASGFSTAGTWTQTTNSAAENGEYLWAPVGNGSAVATWSFTGLTPGTTYLVSASWAPLLMNPGARDAPFSVLDGTQVISLTHQDELDAPSQPGSPGWQPLGYFVCSSGTLIVQLSNASQGTVEADAVMIQRIVGNGGADDNFRLSLTSPAVDAGNPASPVGQEPQPNGGRIDQGAYGGTTLASASPPQVLQVLTPGPLDKLQQGQTDTITWQTAGLYAPGTYYSGTILAGAPLAYYRLDETAGTTATDLSGHGLNATYTGGVQLGQPGALPFDPDTAVTLDGTTGYVQLPKLSNDFTTGFSAELWIYPTAVSNNQTFLDLGNGAYADNLILFRNGSSNDLAFTVYQGSSSAPYVVAHNAIALNQWQYFAVTMDSSGNVTLYKNGVVIATGAAYVPRAGITRGNNYLGKSNFSSNALHTGSLDEAAFYALPLSAAQIAAHYAQHIYGTVNIDLLQNGTLIQNIATAVPDTYSYPWTIPMNVPLGSGYQVRVTANDGSDPNGVSGQQFLIASNGHNYYINDNSTTGDIYTTTVGNDANSGKDSADPMATLSALLQAYPLGPGDTVYIDTGNYTLLTNIMLDAMHSGATISGPTTGPGAVFNRSNTNPGSYDFQMLGGTNLTLSHLTLTGAVDGLYASNTANSTGLTVNDCTIFGNVSNGIFLDVSNDRATLTGNIVYGDLASNGNQQTNGIYLNSSLDTIAGNTVYDHLGTGIFDSALAGGTTINGDLVYGNVTGISILSEIVSPSLPSTVSNNVVRNNTTTGIYAQTDVVVSGNTVYGQSANGAIGISAAAFGGAEATIANNLVYGNYVGVYTGYLGGGDPIVGNRLYNNSSAAIQAYGAYPVLNNVVYSNNIGLQLGFDFTSQAANNLVYANTTDGVLMESYFGGAQIINNTVYQISGNAVRLDNGSHNIELRNNILAVLAGYDVYVADDSRSGFNSDYNDLFIGSGGSASVGFWNSAVNNGVQSQLSNWQAATGQDAHSLSADPKFVNLAGADGLLGYTQVNGTYANYGQDDDFFLSAGSPAIDRGDSWSAPLTDITGAARQDDPGTPNQGSPDYFPASVTPQPAFPSGGIAQGWHGMNSAFTYTLPFSFSFYGQTYTTVSVSTDGFLQFAGPDFAGDGSNPPAQLLRDARIAPLWASLETNQPGDDIYVDSSVANQVTFRWVATTASDDGPANFATTLYSTGAFQFYYGSGNTNLNSTVGISAGNGTTYQLLAAYSGQKILTNAPSALYTLKPGIVDLGAYEFRGSSLDTTPPQISGTNPSIVGSGGTGPSFSQLQVTFSKALNPIDAASTAVYELRKAGSNGFGSPDDVVYSLTPMVSPDDNVVTLTINGLGSSTLPPGNYRFTVFSSGTDTIHDLSGNALDGDGDGIPGGAYVRTFTLTAFSQYLVTVVGATTVQAGAGFVVAVQAADGSRNPVTTYNGPSTLTVTISPASVGSSFPTTVSINSNGLGLFLANLLQVGSYTITVASGLYSGSNSSPLIITPGPAAKLAFSAQPVKTATGDLLAPTTVQVLDPYGNVVASDNTDTVTLSVASGPGSFTSTSTTTVTVTGGVATFNNLTLTVPGTYRLVAVVPGHITGPYSSAFTIAPLQVIPGSFVGSVTGFSVQFNTSFLVDSLTPAVYGSGFGASATVRPTVTLTQTSGTPPNGDTLPYQVRGSLIVSQATNSLTFVETDTSSMVDSGTPLLPDGTYVVDITSSGVNGLQALDKGGGYLDGTNSGTPGHDFTATFTVGAGASGNDVVWLPATADGPGQALSAPGMNQLGGGYPVYLDAKSASVTDVQATLSYNPALLTVSATMTGTFTVTVPTPGMAMFHYNGPALTVGTNTPIGFITAMVPAGTRATPTPYKAKDLLHLSGISLNGGAIPAFGGDAVHLVAYVGDADGNGSYTSNDPVLITRTLLSTDSGFAAYTLVDPVIVADTDGAGFLPADAALQANEAGTGLPTASLPTPPVPPGVVFQVISNNVDPSLSIPSELQVAADGKITVPVNIDDAHPTGSTGLIRGHIALTYNARLFTVSVGDVHPGSLLMAGGGGDWTMVPTIDQSSGQIAIALSSDTPITSTLGGSLVTIAFHSITGVALPGLGFELVASVNPNGQFVATELEDAQGTLTLTPAPVNGLFNSANYSSVALPAASGDVIPGGVTAPLLVVAAPYGDVHGVNVDEVSPPAPLNAFVSAPEGIGETGTLEVRRLAVQGNYATHPLAEGSFEFSAAAVLATASPFIGGSNPLVGLSSSGGQRLVSAYLQALARSLVNNPSGDVAPFAWTLTDTFSRVFAGEYPPPANAVDIANDGISAWDEIADSPNYPDDFQGGVGNPPPDSSGRDEAAPVSLPALVPQPCDNQAAVDQYFLLLAATDEATWDD